MKILYLTVPSFFDLEISLIRELTKIVDLKVLMIVSPESMHSSAFSIDKLDERCDIIPATVYRGLGKYANMINLNDWYIANNPDNSILHGISLAKKIRKFYNANGFTFLHSTTACKTATMNLPFYACLKNTLYTLHDPIPHKKQNLFDDIVRSRMMLRSFKNLLFLSDALIEPFCKRYGHARENIYFSRLSIYDFLKSYPQEPNQYGEYIFFFGRIDEYKGVDILIKAFLDSKVSKEGVNLIVAGKGTLNDIPENLPGNVKILNKYIPNDELAHLIRNCKFVVLPYRTATQSGCVMSAFAFNKPILATRVGDLPNEVIEGETGALCEPNSIESLSKAIDKFCGEDLTVLEDKIKKRFSPESEYSWAAIAKGLVNIYKSIEH